MFKQKFIHIVMIAVLAIPVLASVQVNAAAPGCPADFFTMMSAELTSACKGELAGKEVSIIGTQVDADAVSFQTSFKEFEDWTGIKVNYTGSKAFEADVTATVKGGKPPDMADFPQPGLVGSLAALGYVVDVSKFMNMDWLKQNYSQSWLDLTMMKGKDGKSFFGGVMARNSVKSLVWYNPKTFNAAGYKIPTTWDEMLKLSDQIVADGGTPWCIGIESQAATGWPGTDWIEDIMLRTTTPENYDNWTIPADPAKRLKFTDPVIKAAFQKMTDIWFNDKYVAGGRKGIVATSFGDAPKGLFDNPPKCYLHRQATFITSFFPKDAAGKDLVAGTDYDFFYLPPIDPKYGNPALISGDVVSMFNDRPEVRAVMDWLSRGESVKTWLGNGSTLAPMKDVKPEWFHDALQQKAADIAAKASTVRFDGSDIMPGAVGAGTFFKGITDYVSGTTDLDTTLAEIDAGWPK